MPTVLRIGGYRFFFFSKGNREPPHIHAESAENHAKFWLEPVELVECVGYPASELTRLRRLVVEHRVLFLERWHEHFNQT
jgi:hypothetical protein